MSSMQTSSAPASAAVGGHPADTLLARIERVGSATCVGLDPVLDRLPSELVEGRGDRAGSGLGSPGTGAPEACAALLEHFSLGVIESVCDAAAAVKIQAACFERHGSAGYAAMIRVLAAARASGLVVVLDFKRGDIGISAEHYAASARDAHAQWSTINAYLGRDGIAPFIGPAHGAFALVRTSNPSGDALQTLRLADGRSVAEAVADLVDGIGAESVGACGYSALGAVVGATKRDEIASLRERMPRTLFLVPGYGAQGGTADDVRACFRADGRGALITASRSVIYPKSAPGTPWRQAVRDAARSFADEIRAIVP